MKSLLIAIALLVSTYAYADIDTDPLHDWERELDTLYDQCQHDSLEACIEFNHRIEVLEWQERNGDEEGTSVA